MIPPTGPCPAKIMLVGEAPGEQEVLRQTPFIGASGHELDRMLREAGLNRNEIFVTNLARERPPQNDISLWLPATKKAQHELLAKGGVELRGRIVARQIAEGYALLLHEIEMCKPNLIICVGNSSMWALTGKWGIGSWRGSLLFTEQLTKVLPTYHPAAVLRNWSWRAIVVQDLRRAAHESLRPDAETAQFSFIIRPSLGMVMEVLERLLRDVTALTLRKLSVDIETRSGHIACLGIAWSERDAICIPFMDVTHPEGYWPLEEEAIILQALHQLLTHPSAEIVGQNFIYDTQYIYRHWHYAPRFKRDTMLAHHAAYSAMPKGLDFLSSMYCKSHLYWKDESKEWDPKVGEAQLWAYNNKDCVITYEVDAAEQAQLDKLTSNGWPAAREVHDFQQSLFWPVLKAMNRGVRIDKERRKEFDIALQSAISEREQWFSDVLGHPFNPRSTDQMKALFYGDFQQKPILHRKTGQPTLDEEALLRLAQREPLLRGFVDRIIEIRSLGVFLSTFIRAPLDIDSRMRCSYNIAGTDTYRFASRENAFGSGCLPPEAEVLMPFGWVSIKDVCQGDQVMAWGKNGELRFETAIPHSEECHEGALLELSGEQVFQQVTFGHRVPFFNTRLTTFSVGPAGCVSKLVNIGIPLSGRYEGQGYNPPYPKLLAAALADGSFEGLNVRWSFKKQRKIDRFLALCAEYKLSPREQKAREGYRRFALPKPDEWLEEKEWSEWVLYLPQKTLREMVEEAQYWDGLTRNRSFWFFTAKLKQARWFATAAHLCGKSATIVEHTNSERSYSPGLKMYTVNVKPRSYARVSRQHWSKVPYNGKVYCVSVPSTYFLCRLRDKIFVTGNTNLQNLPKGDEGKGLPNIRQLFLPDPGHTCFDIDLSSADLRIVVWESDESEMKAMLAAGLDPYTEIAKEFYHDPTMKKADPRRQLFKSFAHGTNYLGSARGLAMRLGLLVHEAERTQQWYFAKFPRIRRWQEDMKAFLLAKHYVENVWGYRRYFFDRIDDEAFRQAAAWIPQSTVAILINKAWVRIHEELPQVEVLLQVHDSLMGQFKSHLGEWAIAQIKGKAEIPLPYLDPCTIPVGIKTSNKSWGDCE